MPLTPSPESTGASDERPRRVGHCGVVARPTEPAPADIDPTGLVYAETMQEPHSPLQTISLPADWDVVAPDGSDIRVLLKTDRASMAHGTLAVGQTSVTVMHRTVTEMWFVVGGGAEIWRRFGGEESFVEISTGDALTIPRGAQFQYRTMGDAPFRFVMCTMPAWPNAAEAVSVDGPWPAG